MSQYLGKWYVNETKVGQVKTMADDAGPDVLVCAATYCLFLNDGAEEEVTQTAVTKRGRRRTRGR